MNSMQIITIGMMMNMMLGLISVSIHAPNVNNINEVYIKIIDSNFDLIPESYALMKSENILDQFSGLAWSGFEMGFNSLKIIGYIFDFFGTGMIIQSSDVVDARHPIETLVYFFLTLVYIINNVRMVLEGYYIWRGVK